MVSLTSIFEAVADASWLFHAMFRSFAHRFFGVVELAQVVDVPTCCLFVLRVFFEDSSYDSLELSKTPRLDLSSIRFSLLRSYKCT